MRKMTPAETSPWLTNAKHGFYSSKHPSWLTLALCWQHQIKLDYKKARERELPAWFLTSSKEKGAKWHPNRPNTIQEPVKITKLTSPKQDKNEFKFTSNSFSTINVKLISLLS